MGRMKKELKRLIEEQKREIARERYHPRIYPQVIKHLKETYGKGRGKRFAVYMCRAAGFSAKNIAAFFNISERTVRYHVKKTYDDLNTP